MTKRTSLVAGLLISAALTAIAGQPAFATVTDLKLNSFSFNESGVSGHAPTIIDNGAYTSTSNACPPTYGWPVYGGCQTVTLPYDFNFSGSTTSISPTDPLFIVEPSSNGNSSGNIQVTFGFDYNSIAYNLIENVAFTATPSTDFDSLIWQAGTNGTCNGSSTTSVCTYNFTIGGQGFAIEMDNETDWNMAEFDAATLITTPARVPEPASIAMLGAGLLGFGMLWRRRKTGATKIG